MPRVRPSQAWATKSYSATADTCTAAVAITVELTEPHTSDAPAYALSPTSPQRRDNAQHTVVGEGGGGERGAVLEVADRHPPTPAR
ncbi:hypothetical protein GCM10009660_31730 [Catellatospora bangladeshensis]